MWHTVGVAAGIPDDVRKLVTVSIESVRQLDLLLLMREAGTARSWTTSDLNAVLRSSEIALEQDLAGLLQAKLVEPVAGPPTSWQYVPGASAHTVDRLATCYRTHRTSVIGLVVARQAHSLDTFADAFRFRRKDQHDG